MNLSIIIVNYNVKYFLEQCLCSVVKACNNIDAEVLVVDNHSSDGSREYFANRFPQVQFIWKKENAGFAKANNEALKIAEGKYILFLNPDTIIAEDSLELCLHFFEMHPDAGAVGVHMIDGAGNFLPESKRGFPSAWVSFCKMSGLTSLFPHSKIFAAYYHGHLPENKTHGVDVISGAFMMIPKQVLDKTGSFDEDYFMYAEDIDLSYRIQQAGYTNYYFADTTIIHFKGESTTKQSSAYVKHFYGTMVLFVQKHYTGISKILYSSFLKTLQSLKMLTLKKDTAPATAANGYNPSSITVIGDAVYADKILPALKTRFKDVIIRDVAATGDTPQALLCMPFVTYKKAIEYLQQYKHTTIFLLHAMGSSSMVGSADKSSKGISTEI